MIPTFLRPSNSTVHMGLVVSKQLLLNIRSYVTCLWNALYFRPYTGTTTISFELALCPLKYSLFSFNFFQVAFLSIDTTEFCTYIIHCIISFPNRFSLKSLHTSCIKVVLCLLIHSCATFTRPFLSANRNTVIQA